MRYHFNLCNFDTFIDEGSELPDLACARREAIRLLGFIIAESVDSLFEDADWRMEVTDEAGQVLIRVDLIVSEAPERPRALK